MLLPAATALPAAAETEGFPFRSSVASTPEPTPDLRLLGSGWGHGVGMSQYGAYAMARAGWTHAQILEHYYPGTALDAVDDSQQVDVRLFWAWGGQGAVGIDQNRRSPAPAKAIGEPVRWELCPVPPEVAPADAPPAGCRTEMQPAETTWTVTPERGRVRLSAGPGEPVFPDDVDGYLRVTAQLTAPTDVPPAQPVPTRRLQTINPNTSEPNLYGFGHLEFAAADDGQLLLTNRLAMGAYLRGLAEMPSSWGTQANGGQAALEAQVITARTFAMGRNRNLRATTNDQVFRGLSQELNSTHHLWVNAVRSPAGAVLRPPGEPSRFAQTFYSSSNGGRTENIVESVSYGTTPFSYLISRDDPWSLEAPNPCRAWERRATNADLASFLGQPIPQTLQRVERVRIVSRTEGGTPRELEVRGVDTSGTTRDFVFTRPGASGKEIAGGHIRSGLPVAAARGTAWTATDTCWKGTRVPSAQIRHVGFAPFTDDDGSTHEYATVWANAAGVAEGTSATTFEPLASVTRAQMASFINRTFAIPPSDEHPFEDVPRDSTHAAAINALAAADVARGTSDTTFDPGATVTRAQMASFLARAAGWDASATQSRFSDVRAGSTHVGAIAAIDREGVTTGCGGDRYCPADPVSRGQMASFLYRLVRQ
jgi:SpoIID/LytB domain protein